jgi:hypothetical protein
LAKENSFELILFEAVDEGLSILGESVKLAIYFHVEKEQSIEKEEIPQKIGEFSSAIGKLFGPGARVIENIILQKLCEKLGLDYKDVKNKDLPTVVEELKIAKSHMIGFTNEFRKSPDRNKRTGCGH